MQGQITIRNGSDIFTLTGVGQFGKDAFKLFVICLVQLIKASLQAIGFHFAPHGLQHLTLRLDRRGVDAHSLVRAVHQHAFP